jgi:hypothetical protein
MREIACHMAVVRQRVAVSVNRPKELYLKKVAHEAHPEVPLPRGVSRPMLLYIVASYALLDESYEI